MTADKITKIIVASLLTPLFLLTAGYAADTPPAKAPAAALSINAPEAGSNSGGKSTPESSSPATWLNTVKFIS